MSWAKVCDSLHSHPKAYRAGLDALGLWVLALSHCAGYLTDGRIDRKTVERLCGSRKVAARLTHRLVSSGLWETDPAPESDGWIVHDYLDYNPSRESVIAERNAKREAGKATAAKRWGDIAPAIAAPTVPATAPATGVAIGIGDAPVPSRPEKREDRQDRNGSRSSAVVGCLPKPISSEAAERERARQLAALDVFATEAQSK